RGRGCKKSRTVDPIAAWADGDLCGGNRFETSAGWTPRPRARRAQRPGPQAEEKTEIAASAKFPFLRTHFHIERLAADRDQAKPMFCAWQRTCSSKEQLAMT